MVTIMSKRPATATCATCVFYNAIEEEGETGGTCRRDPPAIEDNAWPEVTEEDWCGHWEDDWENRHAAGRTGTIDVKQRAAE